jgi:hypothetical protein
MLYLTHPADLEALLGDVSEPSRRKEVPTPHPV